MNILAAPDTSQGLPPWAYILVTLLGTGILTAVVNNIITRRNAKDDRTLSTTTGVAETNAGIVQTNTAVVLKTLERQLEANEHRMTELQQRHDREITEVKDDNRLLNRRVDDLRRALDDYKGGKIAPSGYVLIPLGDVQRTRRDWNGALPRSWYPGEDDVPQGGIDARITPLNR